MKILHITPSSNGYEEVELLANKVNRNNSLSVIVKDNQTLITGGILINDTKAIRKVLDSFTKSEQYYFAKSFKLDPFVKEYFEEI